MLLSCFVKQCLYFSVHVVYFFKYTGFFLVLVDLLGGARVRNSGCGTSGVDNPGCGTSGVGNSGCGVVLWMLVV